MFRVKNIDRRIPMIRAITHVEMQYSQSLNLTEHHNLLTQNLNIVHKPYFSTAIQKSDRVGFDLSGFQTIQVL